jgi:hypothetical protein
MRPLLPRSSGTVRIKEVRTGVRSLAVYNHHRPAERSGSPRREAMLRSVAKVMAGAAIRRSDGPLSI